MVHTENRSEHVAHVHEHHHEHDEMLPLSKWWKRAVLLGNAAVGAAEVALGVGSSALSVLADGVHNIGDVVTYREQIENVANEKRSERRRQMTRKLSHWAISLSSLGVGGKAAYDLASGAESHWSTPSMFVAGASLALSGTLYARLRGQLKDTPSDSPYVKDLAKHFWGVDIPSAGLALAGAAVQRYSVPAEQVLGIMNGALGAYVFRPTAGNLDHVCPVHSMDGPGHACEDDEHDHPHDHAHEASGQGRGAGLLGRLRERVASSERPRRWRRAVAVGVTAVAASTLLAGGLNGEDTLAREASTLPRQSVPEVVAEPLTECTAIEEGDSQWSLTRAHIQKVTGTEPSEALTYHLTNFTIAHNDRPDPNIIYPGDCLSVPAAPTIYQFQKAVGP